MDCPLVDEVQVFWPDSGASYGFVVGAVVIALFANFGPVGVEEFSEMGSAGICENGQPSPWIWTQAAEDIWMV